MSMTDPIADFLTRLRNAATARQRRVDVPASNLKKAIAKILYEQHYIDKYTELQSNSQGTIRIYLKYYNGRPVLSGLRRISVPGRRVYAGAGEMPRVLNGLGVAIVSTNRGVMTDKDARRLKVGGEIICYIW
ncbi:MAG: 30S ribosomal protein S8 [Bacteroidetes bacterium]|jgi:small subunit ribosomal protein S8|nr:30S ribosomal protein S8 [Bacteroidota bacterium]MCL5034022.1 30S ribosomal protein S8 [Bacteroidota bacterium]